MKFEWYSLMCTPCLERLRAADFARDKHGRATEDLSVFYARTASMFLTNGARRITPIALARKIDHRMFLRFFMLSPSLAALTRVRNSMIGRSSIRKMVHSRRHLQSWGMCTPRHIERRNPERCCQRWSPASAERCCKGNL
jgi:hypothetical protein